MCICSRIYLFALNLENVFAATVFTAKVFHFWTKQYNIINVHLFSACVGWIAECAVFRLSPAPKLLDRHFCVRLFGNNVVKCIYDFSMHVMLLLESHISMRYHLRCIFILLRGKIFVFTWVLPSANSLLTELLHFNVK